MPVKYNVQLGNLLQKSGYKEQEPCIPEASTLVKSASTLTAQSISQGDDPRLQERRCPLCGDIILITKDRFKPCDCEAVEVHIRCALKDEKSSPRKCDQCGKIWQHQLRKPREMSAVKLCDELTQVCFICGSSLTKFQSGFRLDNKMIRPCFCDVVCHHGCMVERLQTTKVCEVCGASYQYVEYGSLRDYFERYWWQYFASLVVLILLFSLSLIAITSSTREVHQFSLGRLFSLIIGIVLFGLCVIFLWMCIKYTVMRRLPRFHARYAQTTVFDYEPPSRRPSQIRANFPQEMQRMVFGPDLCTSADQALLRVDSSAFKHMSSTPIGSSHVLPMFDLEKALFPAIIKTQVYLRQLKDGEYPKATYYWSNLPATQYYNFYYFNITNPDEVLYYGEKARLVELGPYSWAETEFKQEVEFRDNGNTIYYKNNKTWVFSPSTSCSSCQLEDLLILGNPAFMSVLYMKQQQKFGKLITKVMDLLLLFLGESPLRVVTQGGVSFESYPDPLITLINSNLTKTLMNFLGNPIPLPNVPAMGYFPNYNHTCDEDYIIKTGKDNTDNLALIQKWANMSNLPWWGDAYSSDITESGDGTFQKPGLKKTDRLKQFQSFTCRAFYLHYDSDTTVNGIDAMKFKMDEDTYDTTLELNKGYRYENTEKVDYFPSWPCGNNHTYFPYNDGCSKIDCSLRQFWCNTCCNGTHYGNTVYFPPGIIPLRCLPGQNVPLPFAGFLSPPHFLWSPQEVRDNVYGLKPDNVTHEPGVFDIQGLTGSTVGGNFRMQLSIPIYNEASFTEAKQIYNVFLPAFWVEINVVMRDYARNYIHFNTKELPSIILGIGIGCVVLSAIAALTWIFFKLRSGRNRDDDYFDGIPSGESWDK
ncbi:unnamed protein product [Cylicocyclus nassatus]|uniref:Uncharacterized protein n=1 Tax=Cylicocyclus nassatus TaxID=53992 RepID=A0AA36H7T8_CYLNA|nr:unnamed protein product [Cylicocyclus nassatus]